MQLENTTMQEGNLEVGGQKSKVEAVMGKPLLLAIDQGTTSTRAVVYDDRGQCLGSANLEFPQHYPQPGWVEHDAEEIWKSVATVVPKALSAAGVQAKDLAAIGVTNQRETCVLWEKDTGRPIARAIVWQDRRTTDFCRQHQGDEPWIFERTGLVLDPYFSATKMRWLLDQDSSWRSRAEAGDLAGGTIDSFLIWRLTGGKIFATDMTNASRTLLVDLKTAGWDPELCRYFGVPPAVLPKIKPSAGDFGVTRGLSFLPDGIPITGVAGDQQAALVGQMGFASGDAKCTYGTGAFFLVHTGNQLIHSKHRLLTTLAASTGKAQYALEGSIFIAGAAVQWLRDGLRIIESSSAVEALASRGDANQPVIFVPGLVGLGAPHWVPEARGVLFGLTRGTGAAELARASLEGVAFQVADLIEAACRDTGQTLESLRVDGGMSRNNWFLQCQSDVLGLPVLQARESESTALGAAFLAGLRVGVWPDVQSLRRLAGEPKRFEPRLPDDARSRRLAEWRRAVKAVIDFYRPASG
jgi:glycerol kinase